jgi:hypothetical protein
MSEFLQDLLKKAKDNADALEAPPDTRQGPFLRPEPAETSPGSAPALGLPSEPAHEPPRPNKPGSRRRDQMSVRCPSCDNDSVVIVNRFRRAGTGVGLTLGAMVGPTAGRAAIRLLMSAAGGPAGAILGAIVCAIVGGCAGRQIGRMIDEDVICQYKCLNCKYKFYT